MPTTTCRRWPDASSCQRSTDRPRRALALLAMCLAVAWGAGLAAQTPPPTTRAEPSGQSATVVFFNRPIVVLRARVLGRGPAERAEGAERALEDLVEHDITGPVESQPF